MDWWHNLQPGQGALLGGVFVLTAGILAFGTGFLERWRAQRIYHYEEVKRTYVDALAAANEFRALATLPANERKEVLLQLLHKWEDVRARLQLKASAHHRPAPPHVPGSHPMAAPMRSKVALRVGTTA